MALPWWQHHKHGLEIIIIIIITIIYKWQPPSVEDDVDVWCYAIVSCMPEMTTTTTNVVDK